MCCRGAPHGDGDPLTLQDTGRRMLRNLDNAYNQNGMRQVCGLGGCVWIPSKTALYTRQCSTTKPAQILLQKYELLRASAVV